MTADRWTRGLCLAGLIMLGLLPQACGRDSEVPDQVDEQGVQPSLAEQIDHFLQAVIEVHDVPGLTAVVVQHGDVVYERAFGVEDLETGEPLTPEHLFHFASVSKPFVATAVMQLVEQGKLNLDEKVGTYLPYFELADPAFAEITVRQMLNHTSGMPDVEDYEWDNPQTDPEAAERYVRSLTQEKMIGPPGGQCVYSNMAFDTLGDVIAKISGQSFEDYMKANILDPLGMTESTFYYPDTRDELRTTGHVWWLGPSVSEHYPYNRRHAPSSTLNSSVAEMGRWVTANLNRGELDGVSILADSSYDTLWTPSAEMGRAKVGLSWFLREIEGVNVIDHGGGDTGFSSYIALIPESGSGFVLASNYDRTPMGLLRDGLLEILAERQPEKPLRPIGYDFAEIYFEEGLEVAKAFYREAEASDPLMYQFSVRQLIFLGYYLLDEGDVDSAIEVLTFNVELFPDEADGYESLGEAHLEKGNKQEAIANYSKALELDPDNPYAKEALAELGVDPGER